ncbi:MAG: hypothetical protein ACREDV_11660 [Methylocella sp.]
MSGRNEYRLRIDVFSVESLPMSRLAEYMAEFARLLGDQEHVHFSHLEHGSAVLVSNIEEFAVPKVGERLQKVREGHGPKDAMQAYKALDTLLAKDNAVASLTTEGGEEIIAFLGRTRPKPIRYGPFREYGSLDGTVIRLGGRDETIPVLLADADGAEYHCQTSVQMSKQLASHYRGSTVRVYGSGKWVREEDGSWTLQQFDIDRLEVIDDSPLMDVVAKLRAVEGSDWSKDAALGDVLGFRREEGNPN